MTAEPVAPGRIARRGVSVLALVAAGLVAACADGPGTDGAAADTGITPAQSVELVERDVEAPEIFQVTEEGLWDGRPSLGGVWVAHPDVAEPERVIIRNEDNGAFVIGALFRRERENPGPALQVSSDAAEALQMLAGAPAVLNVTALRREEAAEPAPTEAAEPVAVSDGLAPADEITSAPLDPVAGAAAAIDAAEAAAPAIPAPVPAAAPASALERPFIQLGIFSIRANAENLVTDLDAQGLPARVVESASQGTTFWRVLVGPAATEAERARYLDAVKAEGFADAYFVRN